MRLVPRFQPIRATVAAILFLGWVVATNHCALGLMRIGAAPQEHQQCPGHSHSDSPGNGADHGSPLACCKTIQAPALTAGKIGVDFQAQSAALDFFVAARWCSLDAFAPARVSEALDTGPPFAISFAESVLQRSLLSHAPPLV